MLNRPELNRLRDAISNKRIVVVIVYDIDRLARKSAYQVLIEEEFFRSGVGLEYVIGQYDDSDEGRLQKQIRASIAEYEKAKIIERNESGKRGIAKSGYVVVGSRPPYGYKVVSELHKAWLKVDDDEARVVRMIFQWYQNGDEHGEPLLVYKTLKILINLAIPTHGDKDNCFAKKQPVGIWSAAIVINIINNEAYAGIWHYGKTKMVNDGKENTQQQRHKPRFGKPVPRLREEWIAVPVPAIISREDYTEVQRKLMVNIEQANRYLKPEYLMARRLRCAKCGYACIGMTHEGKPRYYRCNGTQWKPKLCDMPYFRMREVDDAIWVWLSEMLSNAERLAERLKGKQVDAIQSNKALFDRLNIIERRITVTEKQIEQLLDLYLSNVLSKESLQERKGRLDETLAKLLREQSDISTNFQNQVLSDDQIAHIATFCEQIRQGPEVDSLVQRRQIIDLLDVRCTLTVENGVKVIYLKCLIGRQRLPVV
jgi:site-specific DNA recombinase